MAAEYRNKVSAETTFLRSQMARCQKMLTESSATGDCLDSSDKQTNPLPEESVGIINLAIGLSNLIIEERFKQFLSLIEQHEKKTSEKEIRLEDLAGFWDMIFIQVEEIRGKFEQIYQMEKNGWKLDDKSPQPNACGDQTDNSKPKALQNKSTNQSKNVLPCARSKQSVKSNFKAFLQQKKRTSTSATEKENVIIS